MATPPKSHPKSISVQQLSGAVHKAVTNVKVPAGTTGPYAYINPGIICGIIYYGPGIELPAAHTLANTIAAASSEHIGQTLAGDVQSSAAGANIAGLPHLKYIICGFKLPPEAHVLF